MICIHVDIITLGNVYNYDCIVSHIRGQYTVNIPIGHYVSGL